jgi:hypothetical protein
VGRLLTSVFALGVLAVLVLKLTGFEDFEHAVDAPAVVLLIVAVVLGFVAFAPEEARGLLRRLTNLKFGSFELGLQATARVERVELRVPELLDDDVKALTRRPEGGSVGEEFDAVREKLKERLDFIRDVILKGDLESSAKPVEIVGKINERKLLESDESQVVRDLLGDAREEVEGLAADVRKRYLDGAWRFASRFATLILERQVRKRMATKKWLLLDVHQTRGHRPDFIAMREEVWLIATRVEPNDTKKTRRRLSEQPLPYPARRVVVYPDGRKKQAAEVVNEFENVELIAVSEIEETAAAEAGQVGAELPAPPPQV